MRFSNSDKANSKAPGEPQPASELPAPMCGPTESHWGRLGQFLLPLATGLWIARVVVEGISRPLPLVALAAACVLWPLVMAYLFRIVGFGFKLPRLSMTRWWPLLLLLIYVVWPARDGRVAVSVIPLALITMALLRATSLPRLGPGPYVARSTLIVFILSLAFYVATLQKDVLPADSGEFQLVVSRLGIAHPPGFPLYTMVGKLFTLLTPWRPALGLNLMSAVLAALTLMLVFAMGQRLMGQEPIAGLFGGLAAALALGTSTTFWAQATTANIRMPTMFLVAWCLYEILNVRALIFDSSSPRSTLTRFALAFSLSLGHYPPLIFIGLFFIVYLILADSALLWTPRRWLRPLAIFALGQLVWLYLPLRDAMGALNAPGDLTTVQGLLYHVLAQGFAGDMFAFAAPPYLQARLAVLPTVFLFQFNPVLLVAAGWGAWTVLWRDWRLAILLVGGWAAHVFITITYRAPQTVEYMMPAYLLQVVALGAGVGQLVRLFGKRASPCYLILAGGILLAGLLNGVAHAPGYIELAGDHSTRDDVTPILQQAPPGALILADWHWVTPMQYLQVVEGLRPDVTVEYVYPVSGVEYAMRWLQRIEQEIVRRPVVVTRYAGLEYSATSFTFQPLGRDRSFPRSLHRRVLH